METKNNGILLVDKTKGSTSFKLVAILRRLTKLKKLVTQAPWTLCYRAYGDVDRA